MMDMNEAAYMLRAISNETRLKVIDKLRDVEELTVSELINEIGCEQSLLSHHLTDMRAKGILTCRKEGKNCFYSLRNKQITQILDCIQSCNCN
jgi:ArsR family transcriptional regulator